MSFVVDVLPLNRSQFRAFQAEAAIFAENTCGTCAPPVEAATESVGSRF
jgi:hypothetical protein